MKKFTTLILLGLLVAATVRADTALTIPALYSCLTDFGGPVAIPSPPTVNGTFNLNGASGQGLVQSQVPNYWDEHVPPVNTEQRLYTYNYTIDLSGLSSAASHCVKLLIHFGGPAGCAGPGVAGNPSQIQSATLGPWGDITFVFNNGCLAPGQSAISFSMVSVPGFKTNVVTVIDDYIDPASGQTNEVKINVPAIVPDIPPDPPAWVIAYYYSRINPPTFQGVADVGTNQTGGNIPIPNGNYDFRLQYLMPWTNGPAVSQAVTQSVPVVNGQFTVPLPGDPVTFGDGSVRQLSLGLRPTGSSGGFTQLTPLPITPAPEALYAFSAGSVADLAPGQAVTSLNGLTDIVNLQAGSGIILGTNGNALTISAQPGTVSDRALKADFAAVNPAEILARVVGLPIESWRYTNEVAGVRHVGPMAQDFKAAFGLGESDKIIDFVDEPGVALAAIQGLNQQMEAQRVALQQKETEITELKHQLGDLKQVINQLNRKFNGGTR